MKYKLTCPACDQSVTAYTHHLNAPLALAFVRLVEHYFEARRPVNINQEIGLDHAQICNFTKLRYFGLVDLIHGHGWVPSTFGIAFYEGRASVSDPSGSLGNQTLPPDHEAWKTHKNPRRNFFLRDVLSDFVYKKRPEYQAEKSSQTSFL